MALLTARARAHSVLRRRELLLHKRDDRIGGATVKQQVGRSAATLARSLTTYAASGGAGSSKSTSPLLRISKEVQEALSAHKPVVALESTIITHGLPYPQNLQTALAVEQAVREEGAIPATTALLDGYAHVGLEREQLERLAEAPAAGGNRAVKASRRDLAQVLAAGKGGVGGTTVSATMILAHMANIDIFGTGGIGGVHRGGESSMDVSADLTELGRTPVAVFCSGAKSILDIPRTLEYLETQGVAVGSFASTHQEQRDNQSALQATNDFPSFYTARSGCPVPLVSSPAHAASIIQASKLMGLQSGQVFGVPIPAEYEAQGLEIQQAVEQAVRESVEQGIDKRGKEVTPWLLARVKELKKESVASNVALVINNCRVAARTAVELQRLKEQERSAGMTYASAAPGAASKDPLAPPPTVLVFGGAVIDVSARQADTIPLRTTTKGSRTTHPGSVQISLGGVGRNIAHAAQLQIDAFAKSSSRSSKQEVQMVAPVCRDSTGDFLKGAWQSQTGFLRTDGLFVPEYFARHQTPAASLTLRADGDLESGIINTSLMEEAFTPAQVTNAYTRAPRATHIAFDCNLGVQGISSVLTEASRRDAFLLCEPTSLPKASRIVHGLHQAGFLGKRHVLGAITPNVIELQELARATLELMPEVSSLWKEDGEQIRPMLDLELFDEYTARAAVLVARLLGPVFLTLGHRGVLSIVPPSAIHADWLLTHALPPISGKANVVNTTGAGDTLAGALLALAHLAARKNPSFTNAQDLWRSPLINGMLANVQTAALKTLASHQAVGDLASI